MYYDPHSNAQLRFERTDRTGRWTPIHEVEPRWVGILRSVALSLILLLWLVWGGA